MNNNDGKSAAQKRYVPPALRNRLSADRDDNEGHSNANHNSRDRDDHGGGVGGFNNNRGGSAWGSGGKGSERGGDGGDRGAPMGGQAPVQNSRFDCLKEDDGPSDRGTYADRRDGPGGNQRGDNMGSTDVRQDTGKGGSGWGSRREDERGGGRFNNNEREGSNNRGGNFGARDVRESGQHFGGGGQDRDADGNYREPKARGKGNFSTNSGDVRASNTNFGGGDENNLNWARRRDGRRNAQREEPSEFDTFGEPKLKARTGINFDEYDKIPVQMSGSDIDVILPIEMFSQAKFDDQLCDNIRRCGYDRPTPIQKYAVPIVCGGRDLMACAQTGSGKTAAFLLPTIQSMLTVGPPVLPSSVDGRTSRMPMPVALVMAPTRELASQISDEGKKFSWNSGIRVCVVYGGADMREQRKDVLGGVDILVATPGRLKDMKDRDIVSLGLCRFLMLDEADRMLDMGFEPQVRAVVMEMEMGKFVPGGQRQSLMFSATFPKEVQMLAQDFLYDYVFLTVGRVGSTNEFIEQKLVYADDEDKIKQLQRVIVNSDAPGDKNLMLVFVETKRGADELERSLWNQGHRVTAIHGDRTQQEREEALLAFRRGENPVLVATDVAARGLDIPDVQLVINYDMPKNIDDYVHRIGRTGRAGRKGKAIAFINEGCNRLLLKELNGLLQEAKQERPLWFQEMMGRSGGARQGASSRGGYDNFGGRDARTGGNFRSRDEQSRQWAGQAAERTGRKVEAFKDRNPEAEEKPRDGWGYTGAEDAW